MLCQHGTASIAHHLVVLHAVHFVSHPVMLKVVRVTCDMTMTGYTPTRVSAQARTKEGGWNCDPLSRTRQAQPAKRHCYAYASMLSAQQVAAKIVLQFDAVKSEGPGIETSGTPSPVSAAYTAPMLSTLTLILKCAMLQQKQ